MVAHADPAGVPGKILGGAVVRDVVKVNRQRVARLHRVHQAKAIECRALLSIALGKGHGEGFSLEFLRLLAVALDRELDVSRAAVALWVVREGPRIAGAVVLDGRGPELAH